MAYQHMGGSSAHKACGLRHRHGRAQYWASRRSIAELSTRRVCLVAASIAQYRVCISQYRTWHSKRVGQ
eukprot:3940481-Rhodomonas_salina.3